jgi:putative phosphoesterase
MKICILSDSHDNRTLLRQAVEHAVGRGVGAVLHAGDVVAPSTLSVLQPLGIPVHVVHGNNGGDLFVLSRIAARKGSVVNYHGADADLELAGRRVFMVHYPHYARGMACTGDYDLVCCGHSHRADIEVLENAKGGTTVFVDAGTVGGVDAAPTYVLADLAAMTFEIVPFLD